MIHVCFGLYDKTGSYSKFTGTAMLSLFENTSADVTVHILHDDTLTQDNREKFIYLAGRYNQLVKFYNVEELCPDKISEMIKLIPYAKTSRLSVAALYRLLIPQIFPADIDKCIYLDSDIIVNLDIKELWQIELGDKVFAAVPEILSYKTNDSMKYFFPLCEDGIVKCEDYFNSGVLLMNLNRLRNEENKITDGLIFCSKNHKYQGYGDQDILNYCFSTQALKLPAKFNRFSQYVRLEKESPGKKIYHYAGGSFGLGLGANMKDFLNRLWMNYFIKSPWFDTEAIGRFYDTARAEYQKGMINLSAAMSGKIRAFMTTEENLETLVEKFSVKEYEEIILVKGGTPVQKIIDAINISRNEKFFFIMFPNFPFNVLKEAGLVEGEDFLNAYDFLLQEEIMPFKSYPLIKAL